MPRLARVRRQLVAADPWPVEVGDAHLLRADGWAVALLECATLDVTTLDADRRSAAVGAVDRMCRTLSEPLQLVVQVRRRRPQTPAPATTAATTAATPAADVRDALRAAERAHAAAQLAAEPSFTRRVLAVCSAPAPGAALERSVAAARSALAGGGVETTRLDGAAAAAALGGAWSAAPAAAPLDACGTGDARTAGPGSLLSPPPWLEHATHLRCGRLLLRGLRLARLPGTRVEAGWLAPLLRVRAECDVAIHLHPAGLADAVSRLDRRLRHLHADQLTHLERGTVGDAGLEAGVDAALDLRDRLARNTARPLWLSLTAVARATDAAALDAATDALQTAFQATLAGCEPAHLEHLDAAVGSWPLAADRSPRRKLTDSAAAASCIPLVEAVCDDPDGYPLGRAAAGEAPVRLAPFDTGLHANANVAILAASGRGKSYALGLLVLAAAARGTGSVIVDPEGEHSRLVRALGGEVLELRPGCGSAFNVFECGGDPTEDNADEVVGAVVDLVGILAGGLSQVERAVVDSAARAAIPAARAEDRVPVLGDCLDGLRPAAPRVATVLDRFCGGGLGELFNHPTTVRADSEVLGITLLDLRDELVPAATLIVAEWLWSLVRRDRRERHLVFDEVGLLCAHPPLRTLLAQLARRCRKYRASLVIATQNAGDLLSSEEGQVMATNPAIVLLGGHRGAETQRMEQAYALTPRQRAALEGAARGEFLLLAGSRRLPVRIEAPALHHALLTGGPAAPPAEAGEAGPADR